MANALIDKLLSQNISSQKKGNVNFRECIGQLH